MMRIQLFDAGKRFNRDWIFRHANLTFLPGHTYAITGNNGSGKSTLLQVVCGSMDMSEGKIKWQVNRTDLDAESIHTYLTIAAPYLEVVEEMTAVEFLHFHRQFKPLLKNISVEEIISLVDLEKAATKQIRYYSSGMKQRLKLAQAIFSDVPLLLLDEPCTNLDESGYALYHSLIQNYAKGKTIIVSSNDAAEYSFCENIISVKDFK